jgi:hypothetical protein
MHSSDSYPALPKWPFILADCAAVLAAIAIAYWSPHPLSATSIYAIVACIVIGACCLLPLVVLYERQKHQQLDERQRALESLARTITSSAEQISIATKSFHDIAELAQKNIRLAEQLPHKLQDKIAEFQSQLAAAADLEKEELERELLALRTTESERLETVSQRIAKSAADWSKIEAAAQQHLAAANDALSKLAFGTAGAIGKAQVAAEQALAQARVEAARSLGESSGNATRAIESAKSAALAELETRLAAAKATVDLVSAPIDKPAALSSIAPPAVPSDPSASPAATSGANSAPTPAADASNATTLAPPKRPRKVRREEPAPGAGERTTSAPGIAVSAPSPGTMPSLPEEPLPVPAASIPEITPIAPATAEPFSGHITNGSASPVPAAPATQPAPVATAEPPAARKRVARKPEAAEPDLGLDLDDSVGGFAPGLTERVRSSDGATRLLVTAYIGIGNRLFIRGQGPGLSWDKGVPLQFVSIGKWRWETNDANSPVRFKLYKNDDLECSALGALSLDPGHQQEVTAAF